MQHTRNRGKHRHFFSSGLLPFSRRLRAYDMPQGLGLRGCPLPLDHPATRPKIPRRSTTCTLPTALLAERKEIPPHHWTSALRNRTQFNVINPIHTSDQPRPITDERCGADARFPSHEDLGQGRDDGEKGAGMRGGEGIHRSTLQTRSQGSSNNLSCWIVRRIALVAFHRPSG